MTITELLAKAELPATVQGEDKHLSGLAYDSREAKAGDLFFCLVGLKQDGHSFAPDAYQKGVRAFVVERLLDLPQDAAQILVPDSRAAIEIFSAAFWDFPARKLKTVGVTGTNGKTTTTYMIRSILSAAGFKVGLLGTIGNLIEDEFIPAERTTPEAPDSQALFAQMVEKGLTHLVMEVSSHAIHQKRISGRDFTVGVFTNLSQDHLDYHETMEEYSQVKADFFRQLPKEAAAVINLDDPYHKLMAEAASCRVIGYSLERGQLKGKILSLAPEGMTLQMETPAWREEVRLSLTGSFNAANALAAAGAALALGIDKEAIVRGLEDLQGVPGRFQRIGSGRPTVIVDYDNTPAGLANVLSTARKMPVSRIIVVFGCGGDRDRGKRPQMGRIAGELADFSIITSDNPRSEDPLQICAEVEAGIKPTGSEYIVEPDRKTAICRAIAMAEDDDLVLIAGKGHETYQIFRDRTIHFDDGEVALQCLKERGN